MLRSALRVRASLSPRKKYTLEEIGLRLTMRPDGVEKARHAAENRLKENYQESKLRLWRIVHRAVMDEALHCSQ